MGTILSKLLNCLLPPFMGWHGGARACFNFLLPVLVTTSFLSKVYIWANSQCPVHLHFLLFSKWLDGLESPNVSCPCDVCPVHFNMCVCVCVILLFCVWRIMCAMPTHVCVCSCACVCRSEVNCIWLVPTFTWVSGIELQFLPSTYIVRQHEPLPTQPSCWLLIIAFP